MHSLRLKLKAISNSKLFRYSATVAAIFAIFIYVKHFPLKNSGSAPKIENLSFALVKSRKTEWSSNIKILCYILLSQSKLKAAMIIKETWGTHCDHLIFFGAFDYPLLPVTYLNVSEGYKNLWGKSKAAVIYLSEKFRHSNYNYFLKADDDTFVIVENLRKFLKNSDPKRKMGPAWFGFKLKHKKLPEGYMSGGAGYVFNYKALQKVAQIMRRSTLGTSQGDQLCNAESEYGIEDLELGKCFLAAGVKAINTTDPNGGERFLPLSYDAFINGGISSFHWIWRQTLNRVRTGEKCCSQDLISMHEVQPNQMKLIYYLLYKVNVWNGNVKIK